MVTKKKSAGDARQLDRELVRESRRVIEASDAFRQQLTNLQHDLACLRGELREHSAGASGRLLLLLLQQRDEARSAMFDAQGKQRDNEEIKQLKRDLERVRSQLQLDVVGGGVLQAKGNGG